MQKVINIIFSLTIKHKYININKVILLTRKVQIYYYGRKKKKRTG